MVLGWDTSFYAISRRGLPPALWATSLSNFQFFPDQGQKRSPHSPTPRKCGSPARGETIKFGLIVDAPLSYFSDFIKCANVLFFHPGATLESKYILKLNRKTIIKDTRLTFVKWLCAPERSAWKAHYELLCVISFGFRSSSTDTEILTERICGYWKVF